MIGQAASSPSFLCLAHSPSFFFLPLVSFVGSGSSYRDGVAAAQNAAVARLAAIVWEHQLLPSNLSLLCRFSLFRIASFIHQTSCPVVAQLIHPVASLLRTGSGILADYSAPPRYAMEMIIKSQDVRLHWIIRFVRSDCFTRKCSQSKVPAAPWLPSDRWSSSGESPPTLLMGRKSNVRHHNHGNIQKGWESPIQSQDAAAVEKENKNLYRCCSCRLSIPFRRWVEEMRNGE